MGLIASIVLNEKFVEINAQPTIFSYDLLTKIDNPPNDFSFDPYIYWIALKNKYKFIRKILTSHRDNMGNQNGILE